MSVILIALPACVEEDDTAKANEKKLNDLLDDNVKAIIEDYVSTFRHLTFCTFVRTFSVYYNIYDPYNMTGW